MSGSSTRTREGRRHRRWIGAVVVLALGTATAAWWWSARTQTVIPAPADWSLLPAAARDPIEGAIARCRETPDDPAAYTALGLIYHGNDQPALAIEAYERALALGASDPQTPYLLALLEADWGRADEATTHLQAALAIDATYAPGWYQLGRTALERGDADEGLRAFTRAIELDRRQPAYLVGLGRTLLRLDRPTDAAAALRTALTLDASNLAARHLMGLTLRKLGRADDARPYLLDSRRYAADVVRDPWLQEAYRHAATVQGRLTWARAYIDAGRLDSAIEVLAELARQYPDQAEVHRRLGEAYARAGRAEAAGNAYQRALTLEPHDSSTRTALAENLLQRGDVAGARREIRLALLDEPDALDAVVVDAAVTLRSGHAGEAADQLRSVIRLRGDHVAAIFWLGEAMVELEQYDEAERAYRRALSLMPSLQVAQSRIEDIHRRRGEP